MTELHVTPHITGRVVRTPPPLLERAYSLARSGVCASVKDIEKKLRAEGYVQIEAHLSGPSLRRDLRKICAAAHPLPAGTRRR